MNNGREMFVYLFVFSWFVGADVLWLISLQFVIDADVQLSNGKYR